MRVLLVTMPFAVVERPAFGLSLLKARLAQCGFECDVLYANLAFAERLSLEAYDVVAKTGPHRALAGEWVFSECLFGANTERSDAYLRSTVAGMSASYMSALKQARGMASAFLGDLVRSIPWSRYGLVGFTSFCEQNLAAVALARMVKERFPRVTVAFGGANWHGGMGVAQLRAFPFVDVGFLGDADDALPAVVHALANGSSIAGIPGLAIHDRGHTTATADPVPFVALDSLPYPDYGDYFAALEGSDASARCPSTLSIETSRGCLWAEHRPCRFCGLNGTARAYRSKTADRILGELREMAARWPGCAIDIVDNLVSPAFISDVLPALAARSLGVTLSFEARPDLTSRALKDAVGAGATVQVGIESLSDHTLQSMGKGLRAIEAVRLLRDCRTCGLPVAWNIILGTPGETDEDYASILELLPSIRFLQPPESCARLCLDRFSPYFEAHGSWGFRGVRPHDSYRRVYDVDDELLWELADTFDYEETLTLMRRAYRYRLRADVRDWQGDKEPGELRVSRSDAGRLVLRDSRPGAMAPLYELDSLERLLYLACDEAQTRDRLDELARARFGGQSRLSARVGRMLDRFVERRLMVRVGDAYLSLALPASTSSRSV